MTPKACLTSSTSAQQSSTLENPTEWARQPRFCHTPIRALTRPNLHKPLVRAAAKRGLRDLVARTVADANGRRTLLLPLPGRPHRPDVVADRYRRHPRPVPGRPLTGGAGPPPAGSPSLPDYRRHVASAQGVMAGRARMWWGCASWSVAVASAGSWDCAGSQRVPAGSAHRPGSRPVGRCPLGLF